MRMLQPCKVNCIFVFVFVFVFFRALMVRWEAGRQCASRRDGPERSPAVLVSLVLIILMKMIMMLVVIIVVTLLKMNTMV